jgi:hypothetical protein
MREILGFRRFTTPLVIAILFWLGLISIVIAGFVIVFFPEGNEPSVSLGTRIGIAIAWIFFASLFWRVLCEMPMVLFRSCEALAEIREALKKLGEKGSPTLE